MSYFCLIPLPHHFQASIVIFNADFFRNFYSYKLFQIALSPLQLYISFQSQEILQQIDYKNLFSKKLVQFFFLVGWVNNIIILYVPKKAPINPFLPHQPETQVVVVSDNSVNQQKLKRMHTYLPKHMALFLGLHLLQRNSSSPSSLRLTSAFLPLIFLPIQDFFAFNFLIICFLKITIKLVDTLDLSNVTITVITSLLYICCPLL